MSETPQCMDDVVRAEFTKNVPVVSYTFSITSVDAVCSLNQVIDCTQFGNITCLLRVTALCYVLLKGVKLTDQVPIN